MSKTSKLFTELVRQLAYFDKKFHVYGIDRPIYSSEIHIVCLIANNPGIHGLAIAEKIGIAKSAVSKMLANLVKRGVIIQKVSPTKANKRICELTAEGQKVFAFHETQHQRFYRFFDKLLAEMSQTEQQAVKDFLQKLSVDFPRWSESLGIIDDTARED